MLLTIYQEGNRTTRTFEQIDKSTQHYLEKFEQRINSLEPKVRKRVVSVISLERSRVAVYARKYKQGLKILSDNDVPIIYIVRYIRYLFARKITHNSYGFNGK